MRVPPALGPSTVECTQTNIHVALGSSKRTMTSSPPQAGSRSSNTRHSDREVVDFFAFFAARFSLIDFCAVFLACFSPLSFACAITDLRSVGAPIMTLPLPEDGRGF